MHSIASNPAFNDLKFQSLKSAIENILVSNHRLSKASLFHKPAFRDTKRLLAMKYKELEKLMGNIRAKLSYLGKLKSIFTISNIFSNYVLATLITYRPIFFSIPLKSFFFMLFISQMKSTQAYFIWFNCPS